MRQIIRVLGSIFDNQEDALTDAKKHCDDRNYLIGYVQTNDEDKFQSVVFIDNKEEHPVPRGEGISLLQCVTGPKLEG